MFVKLYWTDPETGEVHANMVYRITADEAMAKWPKQYSLTLPKKADPDLVKDSSPPIPNPADFKEEAEAKGPPVEDRN